MAYFAVEYLCEAYPERLKARYQIDSLSSEPLQVFEAIGRARGAVKAGHAVNYHKVAEVILHEIRAGRLGLITFESPEMALQEQEETRIAIEEKRKDAARKVAFKKKRKSANELSHDRQQGCYQAEPIYETSHPDQCFNIFHFKSCQVLMQRRIAESDCNDFTMQLFT